MLFILERIFSLLVISNQELGNKTWLDLVFHKVFSKSEDESIDSSTDSSCST
ncbi:conserved hypothetical protein [Theileria orientalis strain Shintoku]|uniref:Uncharacterized protein n=1 Tax=Theileria orientalis strain Shintoku TaxID=869250 RepID=J4C359_THEOR|nr:conserved hypothetical protein [Theileria orientalis strain Shintoku]BAM39871.1 conserved hypothetical protein [Theileria orientalis strain Shintoku]|eukprot:XP_009690172.1 conserved hypothetical protein [Theileria orientalis strain Shintoku]